MSFFNNSDAGEQSSSHMTNDPRNNRNPPALQSITSTQAEHQLDLWEIINIKVGPKRARAGDQGDNRKPRLKVRWEGLQMFGWVNGAWKPAAYHIYLRKKLILRDAEQPGAPVWRRGESLDYTSYSPLTRGWTEDLHSIKDRQGREVLLIPRPANDWSSRSINKPLMYEGLVVLDINNRPIREFPGCPLTLKSTENPWILEGLRRCFGMTVWDLRCRMPPVRNSPNGRMWLQGYTDYTNQLVAWRVANKSVTIWHPRTKKGLVDDDDDDDDVAESSEQTDEDESQQEDLLAPTPYTPWNDAASEPIIHPYQSSSTTMHMSSMPEQSSWGGNHGHIPTFFPGANRPGQTINNAPPPQGIYTPGWPSNFGHQNIYAGANHNFDLAPAGIYPALDELNSGANLPANTAYAAPPESIYAAGYPSSWAHQNIYDDAAAGSSTFSPPNIYTAAAYAPTSTAQNMYTAPVYPCHQGNPNPYSTPYDYNTPISTAPSFGDTPTFTNYVGTSPQNLYTRPVLTNEAWHDNLGVHQPSGPTVWEQNPRTAVSESPCAVATAPPAPVLPSENANMTFSSAEKDPFMGADWDADMVEEW